MRNYLKQAGFLALFKSLAWLPIICGFLIINQNAEAVPSFSRQTGAACSQCHTQSFGPNLTPFGRDFKLGGYTLGNNSKLPPISAMVEGSFTHTDKDQTPSSWR